MTQILGLAKKIIDEVVAEDCAGAFSSILASSAKSAIESEQVAVHEAQTQHFALQSQESNVLEFSFEMFARNLS
jgi:hypothetical protein